MRKVFKYTLATGILLILLGAAGFWWVTATWRAEFDHEIEALKRSGALLHPQDLAPKLLLDEENAASLYEAAVEAWKDTGGDGGLDWELVLEKEEFDSASLAQFLEERRDALSKLKEASLKSTCRFNVDYSRGWGVENPLIAGLIGCARTVAAHALLSLRNGKPKEVEKDLQVLLAMAKAFNGEPLLVSQLVRTVFLEYVLDVLRRPTLDLPKAAWLNLAGRLEALPLEEDFVRSIEMERAMGIHLFRTYFAEGHFPEGGESAPAVWGPFAPKAGAYHIRMMNQMVDLVKKPYHEARVAEEAWESQLSAKPTWDTAMTNLLIPFFLKTHRSHAGILAMRGIAVKACRIRAGETWSEPLGLQDPYTGKPMGVLRRDTDILLYSVGPNLEDEKGAGDDIGVSVKSPE